MRQTPHIFLQIKSQYINFNDTEKRIADFVLNNPHEIIYSSITEVADRIGVSDATIFRFSKKLGFKGFQALKISLATEVEGATDKTDEESIDIDNEYYVITKVFKANIAALEDSLRFINPKELKKAVDAILNADQIVFLGNGGSGIVALDAHHKFLRTGLRTAAYSDNHMQLMSVSQLTNKDVIVIISHTGSNLDMLKLIEIAKENGTKTIGITSYSKSPICNEVDISLNVISQETEYQFEAFASRIAHLSVIDALYSNVSMKRKETSASALKKMRKAISGTRI